MSLFLETANFILKKKLYLLLLSNYCAYCLPAHPLHTTVMFTGGVHMPKPAACAATPMSPPKTLPQTINHPRCVRMTSSRRRWKIRDGKENKKQYQPERRATATAGTG